MLDRNTIKNPCEASEQAFSTEFTSYHQLLQWRVTMKEAQRGKSPVIRFEHKDGNMWFKASTKGATVSTVLEAWCAFLLMDGLVGVDLRDVWDSGDKNKVWRLKLFDGGDLATVLDKAKRFLSENLIKTAWGLFLLPDELDAISALDAFASIVHSINAETVCGFQAMFYGEHITATSSKARLCLFWQ